MTWQGVTQKVREYRGSVKHEVTDAIGSDTHQVTDKRGNVR